MTEGSWVGHRSVGFKCRSPASTLAALLAPIDFGSKLGPRCALACLWVLRGRWACSSHPPVCVGVAPCLPAHPAPGQPLGEWWEPTKEHGLCPVSDFGTLACVPLLSWHMSGICES